MKYLLDTNIFAAFTITIPNIKLQLRILDALPESAISAVTLAELTFGSELLPEGRRRREMEDANATLADELTLIDFDAAAALWFGRERARMRRAGREQPILDLIIAATAMTRDLIVVTDNIKDFEMVEGLKCENWLAESRS